MDPNHALDRPDLVVSIQPSRLAAACAARGWSYKELARRSRLSRPTVTAARRGFAVRPLTAYKILRALETATSAVDASDLLGGRRMDGVTEGARDLVLAIFRMAVDDYVGQAHGHDGPGRPRRVRPRHRADAELFLRGPWAACLGEWINLPASSVWAQARATRSSDDRPVVTGGVRAA